MSLDNKVTLNNITDSVSNLDSNFLPKGTIIHVELDGSGDFTNLQDALNYIKGKYSNGTVTIQLGNGTFNLPDSLIKIDGHEYNISGLVIAGRGTTNTILKGCISSTFNICVIYANVTFKDLKYTADNGKIINHRAILTDCFATTEYENVSFDNLGSGFELACGNVILRGTISFSNCTNGIVCATSGIVGTNWGITLNASNISDYLFVVTNGGRISTHGGIKYTGSNVAHISNVNKGVINSNGYIYYSF